MVKLVKNPLTGVAELVETNVVVMPLTVHFTV